MADRKIKVILDTNIWVSFLISKSLAKLDKFIIDGKVKLIFSDESLAEFVEVISRKKLKKYFSQSDVVELFEFMHKYGTVVNVQSEINKCRDPDDNFLLALAKDGKANYLVTGDNDLLVMKRFLKTEIIKIQDLIKILG
jgi:uncharacterized protein